MIVFNASANDLTAPQQQELALALSQASAQLETLQQTAAQAAAEMVGDGAGGLSAVRPGWTVALARLTATQITLLARARDIVAANLRRLDRFFAEHRGVVEWVRPRAGTVAFPRLLGPVAIDDFAEELAAKRGALILPGSLFDYPGNHFRIGLGRRNLEEGLSRLEEALS